MEPISGNGLPAGNDRRVFLNPKPFAFEVVRAARVLVSREIAPFRYQYSPILAPDGPNHAVEVLANTIWYSLHGRPSWASTGGHPVGCPDCNEAKPKACA